MPDYKQIAIDKTKAHIERVDHLLNDAAAELVKRGRDHDKSKLTEAEIGPLAKIEELIAREGNAPFGSEEYERRRRFLAPMLKNHYEHNAHHPEHWPRGVSDMDLFDVIEMFFDWKAASERGGESSMNLDAACKRFYISDQLRSIFFNTAARLGYKT